MAIQVKPYDDPDEVPVRWRFGRCRSIRAISGCATRPPTAASSTRRARKQAYETIFVDPDGQLTEGSRTNIFVERDGKLLTPPLSRGLMPGILRAKLIEEGKAEEADLTPTTSRRLFHRQYRARADPAKLA